jgi:hypothetical protein
MKKRILRQQIDFLKQDTVVLENRLKVIAFRIRENHGKILTNMLK